MAKKLIQLLQLNKIFKDQSGSMTFFIMMMFTTMIGVAGIAIDIARFEASRTEIQSHLDNATLAAASLRQTDTPANVVDDYMTTAGLNALYTVVVTNEISTVTHRLVEASASITIDTYFMKMFGVDDLDLIVLSSAEENVPHVEVSLVLDISGSMGDDGRLEYLIPAAKDFVTQMLAANDATDPNRVSISLIPYNMHVNAGETLFKTAFGVGNVDHDESYCVEWDESAFDDLDFSKYEMQQGVSTSYYNYKTINGDLYYDYYSYGELSDPYCSKGEYAQVLPFSSSVTALHDRIDNLVAFGNTSLDIGVKMGAALLDPSSRDVITHLTTLWQTDEDSGEILVDEFGEYIPLEGETQAVNPGFAGSPVDYDDEITLKVLVMMTDGENTTEYRIKDSKRGSGNSGVYVKKTDNDVFCFSRNATRRSRAVYCSTSTYDQLGWSDMWPRTPLHTYLSKKGGRSSTYRDTIYSSTKNTRMQNVCAELHKQDVIIFAISYDATDDGIEELSDCVVDTAFLKLATTATIDNVFSEIGGVIEKLKLVQ